MNTHTRELLTYLSKLNTKPHEINTPVDKFNDLQLQFTHQASKCLVDYRQFSTENFIALHQVVAGLDLHSGNYTELLAAYRLLISLVEFDQAMILFCKIADAPLHIKASYSALNGIAEYYHRRHFGSKAPSCLNELNALFSNKSDLVQFSETFPAAVKNNLLGNFNIKTLAQWVENSHHTQALFNHLSYLYQHNLHQNCAWTTMLYQNLDQLPNMLSCLEIFDRQSIFIERSVISNFHIYYLPIADKLLNFLSLLNEHDLLQVNPAKLISAINNNLMLRFEHIDEIIDTCKLLEKHDILSFDNIMRLVRNPKTVHEICRLSHELETNKSTSLDDNSFIVGCLEIENPMYWQKLNRSFAANNG